MMQMIESAYARDLNPIYYRMERLQKKKENLQADDTINIKRRMDGEYSKRFDSLVKRIEDLIESLQDKWKVKRAELDKIYGSSMDYALVKAIQKNFGD